MAHMMTGARGCVDQSADFPVLPVEVRERADAQDRGEAAAARRAGRHLLKGPRAKPALDSLPFLAKWCRMREELAKAVPCKWEVARRTLPAWGFCTNLRVGSVRTVLSLPSACDEIILQQGVVVHKKKKHDDILGHFQERLRAAGSACTYDDVHLLFFSEVVL